ncbi:glycosyltransferase family 39 protein [Actinoplanes sp. M2I2]|uniref:glycosyltransferase family 39 protein n=1 Tax=Actinoplanes sp. M2I2 TaxID=1734444 RepID=UPI0020210CE2|nr:glycosyltransferase family 39 protein [Actinoplanes sp. M2I2]
MDDPGTQRRARARLWLGRLVPVLVPALLMALISARHLATPVLSWDEVATADVATRTPAQIWRLAHHIDAAITPYYFFMHGWTEVFGISEWALRAPSWIAMALTAGLLGALGARLAGPAAGLLAGVIFALIPQTSRYAQEARVYAITCLLFVLATLLLHRLIDRPGARTALPYGLAVALLGAGHLVALSALAGHAVIVGLHWWRTRRTRTVVVWAAAVVVGVLPLAPLALTAAGQVDAQIGWIYGPLTLDDVLTAPEDIAGSAAVAWLLVGLALLVRDRPHRIVPLAALALLPALVLGAAATAGQPFWVPRYLLVVLPWLALLAALATLGPTANRRSGRGGVERTPQPAQPETTSDSDRHPPGAPRGRRRAGLARAVVVLVAVAWAAWPAQRTLRETDSHNGGNYRAAARTVARHQQPGDVVLFPPERDLRAGLLYYLRDDPGRPADFLLSRTAAEAGDLRAVEAPDSAARLRAQQRVWFFAYGRPRDPTTARPDLAPVLRAEFRPVRTWRLSSSTLVLYQRRP